MPSDARKTRIRCGRSQNPVSLAIRVAERRVFRRRCFACSIRMNRSASRGSCRASRKCRSDASRPEPARYQQADRERRVDRLLHEAGPSHQDVAGGERYGMPELRLFRSHCRIDDHMRTLRRTCQAEVPLDDEGGEMRGETPPETSQPVAVDHEDLIADQLQVPQIGRRKSAWWNQFTAR